MTRSLRAFRLRLAALLHPRRQQDDYDEELAFHQHMLREKMMREGTPAAEAETATRRQFGNPGRWHERLAEIRQFTHIENVLRDLSFAARTLRKSPGFALTAILTIALGIGANTAIFSLVNGLLLRPLPVPEAGRLAVLGYAEETDSRNLCAPLFRALERNHGAFSHLFAFTSASLQIGARGGSATVPAAEVSGEYFTALGTPPLLGRYLTPADDRAGTGYSGLASVISEHYWRTALSSDPRVIGKPLLVNKVPFTIVGVMPKSFIGADPTQRPQIFLPLATEPLVDAPIDMTAMGYHGWWLIGMGRMKPGISLAQANASLASATNDVLSGPDADANWAPDARRSHFHFIAESSPGGFTYVRQFFRQPLQVVLGLCCGMLLLACLNLASLLFARSAARQHELATRVAIGATRGRLVQQLLVESLLLSSAGAALGLLLAPVVARALSTLLLGRFTDSYLDTSLDWRVFCAAACGTVFAALLIGLAPALQATGRSLHNRLKAGNQKSDSATYSRRSLLPLTLLSTQIALALVLIVGAGLLAASLVRLYSVGFGFDAHNVSVARITTLKEPRRGGALTRLYQTFQERIAALPGVTSVSALEFVPLSGGNATNMFGRPGAQLKVLDWNSISPDYFQTMKIPLLSGHDFTWTDARADEHRIVLSQSAAALLFPQHDAVGSEIEDYEKRRYQVIAVVGDTKYLDARRPAPPTAYTSIAQSDNTQPSYAIVARVDGPLAPFATAVRAIVARQAPEIPAPIFSTLSSTLDQSLSAERMMAMLSVFFAACALLVTAIGLYGTLAYRTARRTSEIGIRIALGARRAQVVSLVLHQHVTVILLGAAAGLVTALLAARTLASFLYGTSTHDPLVLVCATLLLALVASAASLLPAIRAARIDPLTAIRTE